MLCKGGGDGGGGRARCRHRTTAPTRNPPVAYRPMDCISAGHGRRYVVALMIHPFEGESTASDPHCTFSRLPDFPCTSTTASRSGVHGGGLFFLTFFTFSLLLPSFHGPPRDALSSFLAPSLPFPSLPPLLSPTLLMNLSESDFRGRSRVRQRLPSVRLAFLRPSFRPERRGNLPRPPQPSPLLLMLLSCTSKAEALIHKFDVILALSFSSHYMDMSRIL